jgi:hypothetical protein
MKNTILLLLLIITTLSCKKSKTQFEVDVSQITARDSLGTLIGSIDNSDWKIDNNLSQVEYDLFKHNEYSIYDFRDSCFNKSTNIEIKAYGNPLVNGSVVLYFKVNMKTSVSIRIVDKYLNLIDFYGGLIPIRKVNELYGIKFDCKSYKKGFYRIYYAFYNKNEGLYDMGHGDIEVK